MGTIFSDMFSRYFEPRQTYYLMLGLNAAGKTTILDRLKHDKHVTTIPIIGANVETIQYRAWTTCITITIIWDRGPQDRMRELWRLFYHNTQGLIYVVDSNDTRRIDEWRDALHYLLEEDELRDAVFLVYANKQDLPNAIKPQELCNKLKLNQITNRPWYIQGTCASTGDGLYEGLDWLGDQINKRFK